MQIAVLSDTHARYATVEKALGMLQSRNVNFLIHCGDLDDSETVWLFKGFTVHFVLGNCDHDRLSIEQAVHGIGETCHGAFGHLELEGVKLGFLHGHDGDLLTSMINSGHFDFVFHGHTHVAGERRVGATRVINPGALHRARPKTFLLLDLPEGKAEWMTVE